MIQGTISLTGLNGNRRVVSRIDCFGKEDNLTYHPVNAGSFEGGFILNSHLPYKISDVFYSDVKNDIMVLLSGSVYNRTELYQYFDCPDVPDPEGIARMFLDEKETFVKRLNGDFALFIYRPGLNEAYLFRDHVGVRPLAYAIEGDSLIFSTDAINLSRVMSAGRVTEPDYLLGWFKYIDYKKCPDRKVIKLLPGHMLRLKGTKVALVEYWSPDGAKTERRITYDKMIEDLRFLLEDSVSIRCDQRFTAGAHVSGGLDSGIVASLARKQCISQGEFYGFAWSPVNREAQQVENDERILTVGSCEMSGIIPLFSDMDMEGFKRIVTSFYHNQGYFEEHRTLEQASGLNVNMIFSGWGGDEFISTGDRAIEMDLLLRMKLRTYFRRNPIIPFKTFIKNQLRFTLFPALGILDRSTRQSFKNDTRYILDHYKKSDQRAIKNYYFHTSRRQLHLRYLRFYHLQERCESWAVNGFRHGVEYRYPLLDKRIIEYMLKVPSELLCRTNQFRPILRELGRDLVPEDVRLHRSKRDPVRMGYYSELFSGAGQTFMNEVETWEKMPDLHFIDFVHLKEDIIRYRTEPEKTDAKVLFRSLVYMKAIQSFCRQYGDKV